VRLGATGGTGDRRAEPEHSQRERPLGALVQLQAGATASGSSPALRKIERMRAVAY